MTFMSWLRGSMSRRRFEFMVTRVKQNSLSIIGASIIIFYMIIALLAPVIAPPVSRDPYTIWRDTFALEPQPPGSPIFPDLEGSLAIARGYPSHIFGTVMGLDIYYGCIWGTVTAFRIGFLVASGVLALGFVIGAVAGYFGGVIDELIMKFNDIILAFSIILAIALVIALPFKWVIDLVFLALAFLTPIAIATVAHYGFKFSGLGSVAAGVFSFVYVLVFPSVFKFPTIYPMSILLNNLDKVVLALIVVGSPIYARIVRGEILRMKHEDFAKAAEAVGLSNIGVTVKHIVPDLTYPVLIIPFLGIGPIVLIAAILSFIGIGTPFGFADWGQLISLSQEGTWSGSFNLWKYWYTFTIPGVFLFTFVLGWVLLSNAFRGVLTQSREND